MTKWILFIIVLVSSGCHANFELPKDFVSLARENGTGKQLAISDSDTHWAFALLAACEWTRPKHVSPEPQYRLLATRKGGEPVQLNVRGRQIVVSTATGAGRCQLKPADGQRLAKLGS